MPEAQAATILATPAVEASVALETMASRINWVVSSATLTIPAVTPRLISIQALPGGPPLRPPSELSLVFDLASTSALVIVAAAGLLLPPGKASPVKVRYSEPERLNQRGGVAFTTAPSNRLPSGSTTREPRRTGSTKRARKES